MWETGYITHKTTHGAVLTTPSSAEVGAPCLSGFFVRAGELTLCLSQESAGSTGGSSLVWCELAGRQAGSAARTTTKVMLQGEPG